MFCLLQGGIKNKYQRRQNRYTADNAEDNALCHNYAEVSAEGERHKAERRKARNRCYRTSDNRCQRFFYRNRHRFFVVVTAFPLFVVTVPEEY